MDITAGKPLDSGTCSCAHHPMNMVTPEPTPKEPKSTMVDPKPFEPAHSKGPKISVEPVATEQYAEFAATADDVLGVTEIAVPVWDEDATVVVAAPPADDPFEMTSQIVVVTGKDQATAIELKKGDAPKSGKTSDAFSFDPKSVTDLLVAWTTKGDPKTTGSTTMYRFKMDRTVKRPAESSSGIVALRNSEAATPKDPVRLSTVRTPSGSYESGTLTIDVDDVALTGPAKIELATLDASKTLATFREDIFIRTGPRTAVISGRFVAASADTAKELAKADPSSLALKVTPTGQSETRQVPLKDVAAKGATMTPATPTLTAQANAKPGEKVRFNVTSDFDLVSDLLGTPPWLAKTQVFDEKQGTSPILETRKPVDEVQHTAGNPGDVLKVSAKYALDWKQFDAMTNANAERLSVLKKNYANAADALQRAWDSKISTATSRK